MCNADFNGSPQSGNGSWARTVIKSRLLHGPALPTRDIRAGGFLVERPFSLVSQRSMGGSTNRVRLTPGEKEMRKYDPLHKYLRRKSAPELEMSFAEIERVLGAMLPNSAVRSQWWANEASEASMHVQRRAWRDAGYDAFLIAGAERVRFKRRL